MLPFLSDTTANWLDLFRDVGWWDDVSHFAHWFLLWAGLGLLRRAARPAALGAWSRWSAGVGAVLALGWELGEYALFIRHRQGGGRRLPRHARRPDPRHGRRAARGAARRVVAARSPKRTLTG